MPALNTYPNAKIFNPSYVVRKIAQYTTPDLIAEKEVMHQTVDVGQAIEWIEEEYSPIGDPNRITALSRLRIEDGSLFPHVKFSGFIEKAAVAFKYGLEIEWAENVLKKKTLVNFVDRGMRRASFWLQVLFNDLMFNSMTNSWSTTASTETNEEPWNTSATAVWSDTSTRVPLADIKATILMMVNSASHANIPPDRAYIHWDNWFELSDYLQLANYAWAKDPTTNEWNGMVEGVKFLPVHVQSGIPASTALFLARGMKPTTVYDVRDPAYSKGAIRDESGKSMPGAWHIHTYFKDANHTWNQQIWRELTAVTPKMERKLVGILDTL